MRIGTNGIRHLWLLAKVTAVLGCALVVGCSGRVVHKASNMAPTIAAGQAVRVDTRAYGQSRPSRWDVVAFQSVVGGPTALSIMRVVGLPEETVLFTEGGLLINGLPCAPPPMLRYIRYATAKTNHGLKPVAMPYTIPDLVLCDL